VDPGSTVPSHTEHLRQLGGKELAKFLEGTEWSTPRERVSDALTQ
jgi:hypothetical protein